MQIAASAQAGDRSRNTDAPDRRRLADLVGLAWVLAASFAVLVPALAHGLYLGPFDILTHLGITATPGSVVHNPSLRDQISLFVPSTEQDWLQVHQGHLPLWNPDSGLGLPLAFNWESAPFGLPSLIGYLAPLRFAYTVGVLVTLVVAGTGGYVFARLLRLGVVASAFAGTVFVLSGPMMALLGWSATSVGSWTGWLFAATLLVVRGRRRAWDVAGLAVAIALTIYAGHPETALLVLGSLVIFVVALLIVRTPRRGGWRSTRRPFIDLVIAGGAGTARIGAVAPARTTAHLPVRTNLQRQLRQPNHSGPFGAPARVPGVRRTPSGRQPLVLNPFVPVDGGLRRGSRLGHVRRLPPVPMAPTGGGGIGCLRPGHGGLGVSPGCPLRSQWTPRRSVPSS